MWEWSGPVEETLRPRRRKSRNGEDSERGMPLPPMSPLWRDHGKGQGGGGIHIVVCCCNEEEEDLKVLLSTFRVDSPASCPVRVSFILDSSRSPVHAHSDTVEVLKRALRVTPGDGMQEFGEFGCIQYSGSLDKTQVPFDLYVKGPSIPAGKRNSLVVFFDDILPVKISRGEAVEPDVVYVLDADSGHPANGLQDLDSMWRLLMAEEEAACITCPVRPVNPFESFLALAQTFEYALVGDSIGESHFAVQTTSRGVQCMYKYRSLVEDGRLAQPPVGEGAMPPLLDSFSKTAAGIPAMILLDTCPNEGLLVLLRQRGFDVRACGVADGVTCVPNSWLEFYAQRRRWYAGSCVALLSHLMGKESYFQAEWHRWIICCYAFVANLYLHCGLAFLPVLLARGIDRIKDYVNGLGATDEEQQQQPVQVQDQTDSSNTVEHVDWIVFGVVWAFLILNVTVYLRRSQDQLWMWINITSVLWMALCLAVLVGSGVAVSPWVPVAVLVVPLVLAVLNSSKGMVVSFCYLTVAAVPFVLLTAVNSVLVFLYAMATLDSTEWGTRDVGSFDSGVSAARASAMRRRKFCVLLTVMGVYFGLGIVLMVFHSYTLFPVVVGIPAAAFVLKLLLVVFPAKLERLRQGMLLGGAGNRPLSLRRNASEMAPIHGRAPVYRNEPHGSSTQYGGRNRKGLAGKSPSGNTSHVTAEDGTPSPGDPLPSTTGSFFAAADTSIGSESMSGPAADRPGHRRHGSKSASMSSGFAGVAGVGAGGIGGGSMNSAGSRRSSADSRASNQAGNLTESTRSGTRSRSRSRSRSPSATLEAPAEEVPENPSRGTTGASGRVSRTVESNLKAVNIGTGLSAAPRGASIRQTDATSSVSSRAVSRTGSSTASYRPASGRTSKAEMCRAWGLRQPTDESDDSERSDPMATEASDDKTKTSGVLGARRGWGFTPALQQEATVKSAAVATAGDGVKRYSWARERPSTNDVSAQAGTSESGRGGMGASEDQSSLGDDDVMARNTMLNARVGAGISIYGNMSGSRQRPASGNSLTGIRAAWGVSMGGSQDDMACPSPATINAIQNSRVGAVYSRGIVEDDEGSESEAEDIDPRLLRHGAIPGNQRRPVGGTLTGIRAAWGTSMGGSQDDMVCPSAADMNAVRNSRVSGGSVWHNVIEEDGSESEVELVESRSLVPGDAGSERRPTADTLAGIRAAWGSSLDSSQEFDIPPSPPRASAMYPGNRGGGNGRGPSNDAGNHEGWDAYTMGVDKNRAAHAHLSKATPAQAKRPRSERRAAGGGRGSVGRGTSAGSGSGRGRKVRASREPSSRGERDSAGGRGDTGRRGITGSYGDTGRRGDRSGRSETVGTRDGTRRGRDVSRQRSRGETPGSGAANVVNNAIARRNWIAGQSSVFDSSGSSSSSSDEQGKPRGLRGVQVLDPQRPVKEVRSSGSTVRGAGSGGRAYVNAAGAGPRDPGDVPVFRSHAGVRSTGGSASATGERSSTFSVPRLDMLKGMPGIKGTSDETSSSEYSFQQTRN